MDILHLKSEQITRKILNLLNELSPNNNITLSNAKRIIDENIKKNSFTYVGYLMGEPICIGTLVLMEKLIHGGSVIAQIEDVAVKKSFQRKGYGKLLIEHLYQKAKRAGAYKAILNCNENLEDFYNECGFVYWAECMRKDIK